MITHMQKSVDAKNMIVKGWFLAGSAQQSYRASYDRKVFHSGKVSARLESAEKKIQGFATLMQDFSAKNYRDKRMAVSAYIKTQDVTGWTGLWMQVEGAGKDSLGFDNMKNRALKGSLDWKKYSVILDIPKESKLIGFGILLSGEGTVWINGVKFQEVEKSVSVTNMNIPLPLEPENLDFTS